MSNSVYSALAVTGTERGRRGEKRVLWELRRTHLWNVIGPVSGFGDLYGVYKAGVMEYYPNWFEQIRLNAGLNTSEMAFCFDPLQNLATIEAHAGNKGGRSTAFLYFTSNRRLLIKTLKLSELIYLKGNLEVIYRYCVGKEGENTLIARLMGMYTVYFQMCRAIHVAVFENVLPASSSLTSIFDLKGSTVNRQTLPNSFPLSDISQLPPGSVYKEIDLRRTGKVITVSNEVYERVLEQVRKDSEMLCGLKSMDYSLLLGFVKGGVESVPRYLQGRTVLDVNSNTACVFGIIDYAQKYTTRKRLESVAKRLSTPRLPKEAHSCVNPDLYQRRFLAYIRTVMRAESPKTGEQVES